MKIISWNVNGIRAARRKNFDNYLQTEKPDLMCIQEAKAKKATLKQIDYEVEGYHLYWAEGVKPGYSGVAIWVKDGLNVLSCQENIGIQKFDDEGRTIILELDECFVINSYYPNGREDHSRVDFKLEYSYAILKIAQELEKKKPVILTGDFNTAHFEVDLARPQANKQSTGFLPHEREFLNAMQKSNFIDVFRLNTRKRKIFIPGGAIEGELRKTM